MKFHGIRNIGNTCYLNSAMQCFIHLPLTLDKKLCQENEFMNIIYKFCESYVFQRPVDCANILKYVSKYQSDFQYLRLCDAQEALFYLIDLYHENTKTVWTSELETKFFENFHQESVNEWKNYNPFYSVITTCMTSQIEEVTLCSTCSLVIQKRYPIFTMIDIVDNEIKFLNEGVRREKLDDYKCEKCQEKQCFKVSCWNHCADYLVFYNKKMDFFLKGKIKLPMVKTKKIIEYELVMTINHQSQHFTCFIKNSGSLTKNNSLPPQPQKQQESFYGMERTETPRANASQEKLWFHCDDQRISTTDEPTIHTIYLYVFKKLNNQ